MSQNNTCSQHSWRAGKYNYTNAAEHNDNMHDYIRHFYLLYVIWSLHAAKIKKTEYTTSV